MLSTVINFVREIISLAVQSTGKSKGGGFWYCVGYYLILLRLLIVTDLIYRAVQVLRENLYWIRISAQDAGLMEPVEPWDEG